MRDTAEGLAIGAAIGMVFDVLLFEHLALGCAIGAGAGNILGAVIGGREGKDTT